MARHDVFFLNNRMSFMLDILTFFFSISTISIHSLYMGVFSYHKSVDHWSQYGLQKQKHGAHRTLVGDDTMAISNSGLRLNGEKKSWDKTINIIHTWSPRIIFQMIQISSKKRKIERQGYIFTTGFIIVLSSAVENKILKQRYWHSHENKHLESGSKFTKH